MTGCAPSEYSSSILVRESSLSPTAHNRLAGICAMLFAPLLLVGFGVIVGFSPSAEVSPEDVANYYQELGFGRALFGEWLELLGFIGLLVFAARVAHLVRDGANGWLGSLQLGAAAAMSAVAFFGVAPLLAGAYIGDNGGTGAEQYVLLNTLRNSSHWISSMLLGLWMLAVAGLTLTTRLFPRWLGWSGALIGLILLVAPAAPALLVGVDTGQLLFLVWLFIIGTILLARPNKVAAVEPEMFSASP